MINPVVFADSANIYTEASDKSTLLDNIAFDTPLEIINPNDYWSGYYRINYKNQLAFISANDIATHKSDINVNNKHYRYYFVTHFSPEYNPF